MKNNEKYIWKIYETRQKKIAQWQKIVEMYKDKITVAENFKILKSMENRLDYWQV